MTRATSTTHLSDPTQLAQALREALTGLAADLEVLTDGHLAVTPAELGWTLRGLRPRLQTFFELLDEHADVAGDPAEVAQIRGAIGRAMNLLEARAS